MISRVDDVFVCVKWQLAGENSEKFKNNRTKNDSE